MKRILKSLAVLTAAAALVVVMMPSLAVADGAIVIKDQACGLFDGDGGFEFTTDTIQVGTPSSNCNSTISCKTKGVANSTGKAVHWDFDSSGGISCGTGFGSTTDWHEIVSKSGVAHLICHVKTC